MVSKIRRLGRMLPLLGAFATASGVASAATTTPPVLAGWESWVLEGHEVRRCPWLAPGDPVDDARRVCAWPQALELSVDAAGGRFAQRWLVDIESWLLLPGDQDHWPEHVTSDGVLVPVVEQDGFPALRLEPGSHAVAGEFHWARRPEVLRIPGHIGIVALTVDGARVAAPQRSGEGLFLGRRTLGRQENQLELQVFRRLTDEQPARLLTHVEVSVGGDAREVKLPDLLPAGWVPSSVESSLAARLDPDNSLRLQLRPGRFVVEVDAHGPSPVANVAFGSRAAPWPALEVWSFAAVDRLRVASIEGAQGVDPAVAGVPEPWRQLPAFTVAAGNTLKVVERARGLSGDDGSDLSLKRRLWLDFSGGSYTVLDSISGTMRRDWRLDLDAPYTLAGARAGDVPLLVTASSRPGVAGIEWRAPQVAVTAVARAPRRIGALPATGWQQRFTHASGELIVGPAYRLLAAIGPDATPDAWVERWHLLDLFIVLLATVTAWRLLGWGPALLALTALTLTHQEPDAPSWLWVNVLVAVALARAAPEGRLQKVAARYRLLSVLAVFAALVPFVIGQVRLAVYPQLETGTVRSQRIAPQSVVSPTAPAIVMEQTDTMLSAPMASAPPPPVTNQFAQGQALSEIVVGAAKSASRMPQKREQVVVTSARRAMEYESGAMTQSGPGLPDWNYHAYSYRWNGPVEATETVRFVLSPPWLTRLWRIVGAALSVLLLLSLAPQARIPWMNLRTMLRPGAAALALGFVALAWLPTDARAQATPSAEILEELATRLLAAPHCSPGCTGVLSASVDAGPSRLSVVLAVSALDPVGLALPSGDPNWSPDRVEVDGAVAGGIYRDQAGQRYVPLGRGRHLIKIQGPIAEVDGLTISFPVSPHVVDVVASGWDTGGIAERRLLSGALELIRRRTTIAAAGTVGRQSEFPPFVTVVRNFRLGHEWAIETVVQRVAPVGGGFTARIPLLHAEEPLTPDLVVKDRVISVGFAGAEQQRTFSSSLPQAPTIELTAGRDASFNEIWRFDVAPSWHVDFSGLPAVEPRLEEDQTWRFEYVPRAGEHLLARISRPAALAGATLAFDAVTLVDSVGARSRETSLHLAYRSTQGGRQSVKIPSGARVTSVRADGEPLALRPESGALSLPVLPGTHTFDLAWQTSAAAPVLLRSSEVTLDAPASNVRLTLTVPEDRWVLYATGTGVGPAVLYWGELLMFLVAAIAIGRSGLTQLSSREWLLLGLGLSTFSWSVLALFAAFVAAFQWRGRMANAPSGSGQFNVMQLLLAALAVTALLGLVAAVPQGLLSHPDMRTAGSYDSPGSFHWFVDQTSAKIPPASVISVSLWWYKLAMLAWALWLSFALTRWVRWAWEIFRKDGLWRGRVQVD